MASPSAGTSWTGPRRCRNPPRNLRRSQGDAGEPTMRDMLSPFKNEPFTDFNDAATKRNMIEALERVGGELGRKYGLMIGGQRVGSAQSFSSTNPARPAQVIGTHPEATVEIAEQAVQAALAAFPEWSRTAVGERVDLLMRAAARIRERHLEFCAWLTFEVGKNWAEADADVGECIDFLEFYAREALRLAGATTPIQMPGEPGAGRTGGGASHRRTSAGAADCVHRLEEGGA